MFEDRDPLERGASQAPSESDGGAAIARPGSYGLELPGPRAVKAGPDLLVSEVFRSIQGEGASAGEKATFLRLAMCNLACSWCDTAYTWDFRRYRKADEVHGRPVQSILDMLGEPERLVITGGEPLLQQPALETLLGRISPAVAIEMETNATIEPSDALLARISQWNVSPKLPSSGESATRAVKLGVLRSLAATERAWLKLVVQDGTDLAAADDLIGALGWPSQRILLMPQARTRGELEERTPWLEAQARARGLAVSPRLHILRWGQKRGI